MNPNSDQANESPAAANGPASSSANVGDDVMKVLADVEGKLNRLRTVQKTQDEMLTSLAERTRAVRQAEEVIEQTRLELLRQQKAVQQERDDAAAQHRRQSDQLEQAKSRIEHDRGDMEARRQEADRRVQDLERRETDLKAEQARIAALSTQCQNDREQFTNRMQQVEADRAELLQRVAQAESNVGELIREVEKKNQALAERTNDAKQAAERVAKAEKDAGDLARLADRERAEVTERLDAAMKKLQDAEALKKRAADEAGSLRGRVAELEQNVNVLRRDAEAHAAQLADSRQKLETAGRKLSEFAQILSEQTPQLERGAAAIAMVDQQHEQIDRLTKQLAEATLKSDPEEIQRRDARIEQLTEALRQARGQNVNDVGVAEVEHRNAALEAEIAQLRLNLQNAEIAAEQARKQLEQSAGDQGAQTVQDASMAENAAKVAALTAEIERLHAQAAADLEAQLATRLEAQSKRHRDAADAAHQADEKTIAELRNRIEGLEGELRDAQTAASKGGADQNLVSQKLRKKAEQITAVAEHLRRRKSRLAKMRALLVKRAASDEKASSSGGEMRLEAVQRMEMERSHLAEARQALAMTERAMVRKWARPKAVVVLACVFLLAAACAGAAWLATDHFFPATISASAALEARTSDHSKITGDAAESWRTWHTQLLEDDSFRQTVAKRMAERRIEGWSDPAALAQRMKSDLTVDADDDGMLVLTLAGTDEDELKAALDVITSTVMTESSRQSSRRGDNCPAVATEERREEGQVRFARINDLALRDERLQHALPIFGGMFAVTLVLILVIYTQLARAKRLFDQDNGLLFADARADS